MSDKKLFGSLNDVVVFNKNYFTFEIFDVNDNPYEELTSAVHDVDVNLYSGDITIKIIANNLTLETAKSLYLNTRFYIKYTMYRDDRFISSITMYDREVLLQEINLKSNRDDKSAALIEMKFMKAF